MGVIGLFRVFYLPIVVNYTPDESILQGGVLSIYYQNNYAQAVSAFSGIIIRHAK
jgi:hypothetical protein